MLTLVNIFEIDTEKGIGEESGNGRVGKGEMNNDYGDDAEQEIEPQCVEAFEGVQRPNDTVFILRRS